MKKYSYSLALLVSVCSFGAHAAEQTPADTNMTPAINMTPVYTAEKSPSPNNDAPIDQPLRDEKDDKGIFTFALENDMFSGEDDNYTNGIRLAYFSAEDSVPNWIENSADYFPLFADQGHKRWSFAVGQSMFTPEDLSIATVQPDDRPYAGFLYGTVGIISDTGKRLDNLQLTVGMVGPASQADDSQKFVHSVIGSNDPKGWDNQLHDELGVILSYNRKWRGLYEFSPFGYGFDFTPSLGGNVGNVFTNATAGAVVRFGKDLPSDYGPPLISRSLAGSDFFVPAKNKSLGWYVFAGVEGRAVARNIFLDGNTFRDSHSVDKENFVGDLQGGVAFTYGDYRLAFTQIMRTKEFETQSEGDEYGAITLSARF